MKNLRFLSQLIFALCFICFQLKVVSLSAQRPLSILVAVHQFPVLCQTFIINHIVGLIKEGHRVMIYAEHKGDTTKVQSEVRAFNLEKMASFGDIPQNLSQFDVILCEFGQVGVRFARLKKQGRFRGKLITCFRGRDISAYAHAFPGVYKELFEVGDLFLPVCNDFKQRLIELGADCNKIKVHYSSIDCLEFVPGIRLFKHDGVLRLISVNRLVEKKGTHHIIRALGKFRREFPHIPFEYVIIGDGRMRSYIEKLINRYDLAGCVHLKGFCSRIEIIAALLNSDIFLLGSVIGGNGDADGIANVLKEALAVGLYVVASPASGIKELIDLGCEGIVFVENSKDWKKTLSNCIQLPKFCTLNKEKTREIIKNNFDIQVLQKELAVILSQVCRG